MKTPLLPIAAVAAVMLFTAGCATQHDEGPYKAQASAKAPIENTEEFILLDPGVQYSVTCSMRSTRTLEDGRLEVTGILRNRENRRLEVQANCVFKDINGVPIGDESPFQALILTENAQESVKFTSMNNLAKKYTIRVRQAR
jgi:hypothetical protein